MTELNSKFAMALFLVVIVVSGIVGFSLGVTAYDTDTKKDVILNSFDNPDTTFIERDPITDSLLTSQNSVLVVIDFQDEMLKEVSNIEQEILINNIQAMIKTANLFGIPVIESTIGVDIGANQPTVKSIADLISNDVTNIDRVSLNAWQNQDFVNAVKETDKKKIIMTGLWTSGCPTYTTLGLIDDGYQVYVISDLMGDTTTDAHNRAIERMVQAGAIPFTWEGAGAEILRAYTNPKAIQDDKIQGGFVGIMNEHFYPFAGRY